MPALITIAAAAIITYILRIGGLLLSDKLPRTGNVKTFMDTLPGTILISLVAPGIIAAGFWGLIAAFFTGLCAYKTGNVFMSMLIGIGIIILQRNFL